MRRLSFVGFASVITVLVISAYVGRGTIFASEWRSYQKEYLKIMEDIFGERVQIQEGIQEVGALKVGRNDRCVTCHLGVDEPLLETSYLPNPFGPHPEIYHSLEEFGCTICHQGDGSALTAESAHKNTKFPEYRML